jgi:hypothetical protein
MSEQDYKTADFIVCDEEQQPVKTDAAVVGVSEEEVVDEKERQRRLADAVSGLSRYKAGFTRQGLLWMFGWGLGWLIPSLTTAHWIPEMFVDNHLLAFVPLLILVSIPFSLMGVVALLAGRGYVRRAQQLCTEGESVECRMELKLRPRKQSIYGSTLCEGILTYPDGRTETIKLLARDMDVTPLLSDPIAKVMLIGSPFSSSEPRVVATTAGDLLEQPDISQAWSGMVGLFRPGSKRRYAAIDREFYGSIFSLLFCSLYWPLWACWVPQSVQYATWWFFPTCLTGALYAGYRVFTAWKARRLAAMREPAACTVITQPASLADRIQNKVTMIVAGEGHQRTETLCGFVPRKYAGKVIEASVWYKNGAPWMVAAKDFVLFNNRESRKFVLVPVILYFAALPMLFTLNYSGPSKYTPVVAHSAQEYYQKGVDYKGYGWTEKARESLLKAAELDPNGPVGARALTFLHSHVPANPVPEEAEEQNIKAFNLSYTDQSEAAKTIWRGLINRYPDFEWPYSNLASELLGEGRPAEAVPLLEKALQINPQYTNALHHMFVAKSQLHEREAAIQYLRRCADSDPENAALRSELFLVERSI